jgi:MFS family permease
MLRTEARPGRWRTRSRKQENIRILMNITVQGSRSRELTGRAATATVAALVAIMFMASTLLTPLYVIYEETFHFSRMTLTLVYAVYVVGNLAALLLLGRASDRMGRRHISVAAIVVAALSTILFLFARSTAWLFWARSLNGLAIGLAAGTATAWIAELESDPDRSRATVIATASNFFGLAMGPLIAGLLAQHVRWPLQLPFVVYLVLLALVTVLVARTEETVRQPDRSLDQLLTWPRFGVPSSIRLAFIAPAAAVFCALALVAFYASLIPSVLVEDLGESNHALAGAVVCEMTLIVAVTIVVTRSLTSRTAMVSGLVLMLPGLGLLVAAEAFASLTVLLLGTALSGVSCALGYRGSLQVVNQIAPPDRRAEVVSSYFVAVFTGNAIPVLGVGVVSTMTSLTIASTVFAITLAAFAVVALAITAKFVPDKPAQSRGSTKA